MHTMHTIAAWNIPTHNRSGVEPVGMNAPWGYPKPPLVCQIWDFCGKGLGRENFLKILKLVSETRHCFGLL